MIPIASQPQWILLMNISRQISVITITLAIVGLAANGPVSAADGIVDEVKFGVLAHDVKFLDGKEPGSDINGEVLFSTPAFLDVLYHPRPNLGISANTAGRTSIGYFGLTWEAKLAENLLADRDNFWISWFLGGSLNTGEAEQPLDQEGDAKPRTHKLLGSQALFHFGLEPGYQFADSSFRLSAYIDHDSNAGLVGNGHNEALNDVGMRLGYKF